MPPTRRPLGAGDRPHLIALTAPGVPVPDGDGGYTTTYAPLSPATVWARIRPATGADLERIEHGTVVAGTTHILTFPYHAGVTTHTRITFDGRVFEVAGYASPDEAKVETVALCTEQLEGAAGPVRADTA